MEAVAPGGGRGEGGDRNGNHSLQDLPRSSHLLQLPWESPLYVGQRMAGGGA